jgi:uncharacterized damage-inducible protein DinB
MDLQELRTLVDYHYWARDHVLDAAGTLTPEQYLRDTASSFRSVRDTLVHIHSAEWVWCSRWQGHSPKNALPPDRFPDVETLRARWTSLEVDVRAVLERMGEQGLDRVVEYRMINGDAGRSIFWHMLQHVVNHASYHRGQVTTLLRQFGAAPPEGMDLIAFYRTRTG